MLLEGRTVIVSGVGPGLGHEIASRVLREGANLVIGARSAERLAEAAKELDPSGERVLAHPFDIVDEAACNGLVAAASDRFGGVDALVQVAAYTPMGDLATQTAEDWRLCNEINVIGSTQLVRACAPAMEQRGGGSIVLIGAQAMAQPPPSPQIAYAASKAALLSASLQLAVELGPKKIRVNTVVPTWMWGPPVQEYIGWQAEERGVAYDEVKAEIEAKFPLGEIPPDDDVAEVVILFCTDRMRMVTGQYLRVDAGERLTL